MKPITVATAWSGRPYHWQQLEMFSSLPEVQRVLVIGGEGGPPLPDGCVRLPGQGLTESATLKRLFALLDTPYLLICRGAEELLPGPRCLARFMEAATLTQADMVYADYWIQDAEGRREHPLNDCQLGSIRDDFDFGALILVALSGVEEALQQCGPPADYRHAGFYDLRLKLSLRRAPFHIPECLYTISAGEEREDGAKHFSYVDPQNREAQREMEAAATDHLKRLGAWLEPVYEEIPVSRAAFPVEASVVIPVRNRRTTIAEAVQSALAQKTDFPFNVIVVDNHSDDGTTEILSVMAQKDARLQHLTPLRSDLQIGGCWNEALYAPACGRFAVQLDSDDLYSDAHTLRRLVEPLREGGCALAIGAYTIVNFRREIISPGLIDHREWTEDNGRNNALRINGLGAPRAFSTEIMRRQGFLNVSYGEDYAAALQVSRRFRIGRIYDSLYLCRRWEGNSDASLSVVQKNRHDSFKDGIRTLEIMARQALNRRKEGRLPQ